MGAQNINNPESQAPVQSIMDDNFKRFRGIHLDVLNESGFTFTPSKSNPPVLDGCVLDFEGTRADSLREVFPGQRRLRLCTLSLPDDAPISDAAGLLTFDFGSPDLKMVVWVRFSPDRNAAGIKVGLLESDKIINDALLKELTPEAIEDTRSGFDESKVSLIAVDEKTRTLGAGTMLDIEQVDVDKLGDHWDLDRKPTALIWTCDFVEHPEWKKSNNPNLKHFEIAGGLNHGEYQPVHENLTIAALAQSNLYNSRGDETFDAIASPLTVFPNDEKTRIWAQDQFEFIRGVVWNDDPLSALFFDVDWSNSAYGVGAAWGAQFKNLDGIMLALAGVQPVSDNNLIRRSHFGNLQFLHSMACTADEKAGETKRKIMIWLEVMYTLAAADGNNIESVSKKQLKETKLKDFFDDKTQPQDTATLKDLLLGETTHWVRPKCERRALGSCFHLIQDSYAVGHCKRELLNANEKIDIPLFKTRSLAGLLEIKQRIGTKVGFPQGKWGRFGKIDHFHCYKGQDKDEHGKYDEFDDFHPKADDLNSFNVVLGGRDAIAACNQLARFAADHKRWEEDGVRKWLEENVFFLVNDDKVATTNVEI